MKSQDRVIRFRSEFVQDIELYGYKPDNLQDAGFAFIALNEYNEETFASVLAHDAVLHPSLKVIRKHELDPFDQEAYAECLEINLGLRVHYSASVRRHASRLLQVQELIEQDESTNLSGIEEDYYLLKDQIESLVEAPKSKHLLMSGTSFKLVIGKDTRFDSTVLEYSY